MTTPTMIEAEPAAAPPEKRDFGRLLLGVALRPRSTIAYQCDNSGRSRLLPVLLVEIAFTNTGAGIAPEHLPYEFERFYRADQARAPRAAPGLGWPSSSSW